jgi:predicted glycogen debranching enzyme
MSEPWAIHLGADLLRDSGEATRREWLETNGLGGWASSTVSGAHTRRYHGLLVAALDPPVGRVVLLSRLDETLAVDGVFHELSTAVYTGAVHPRGYEYLDSFERGCFPVATWVAGDVTLRRTVAAVHGHNTTILLYELEGPGSDPVLLRLRPFVAGRDYHHLTRANPAIRREARHEGDRLALPTYDGLPDVVLHLPAAARFRAEPDWYYDFQYDRELYRGLDGHEDLFTHGTIELSLRPGQSITVVATIEDDPGEGQALLQAERDRRQDLLRDVDERDSLACHLRLAADQFLVRRGDDLRTIIAGYPWFTDWGRDTMIALPGIALVTGRHDDARRILQAFAGAVSEGMLPNRFPDGGGADYNTVDATLWFFVAVHQYLEATGDETFVESLMPVLDDILGWHERGTRHGIRVDEDGLLAAGEVGHQLTWMDAKVGDWVVTPRRGKPVEIQALWYNALHIHAALSRHFGTSTTVDAAARAAQVRRRFGELFWNESAGCLYDVVDVDGVAGHHDGAVRPNQLFALSLPFPLIEGDRARQILDLASRQLATPRGLRSLSPADPAYHGHYGGGPVARDGAYHQGTVWGWLIGPYLTAWIRHGGDDGRRLARAAVDRFADHLRDGCLGSVAEIFDGDAPHEPRGAIAQAWSVAELLRVLAELDRSTDPDQQGATP